MFDVMGFTRTALPPSIPFSILQYSDCKLKTTLRGIMLDDEFDAMFASPLYQDCQ